MLLVFILALSGLPAFGATPEQRSRSPLATGIISAANYESLHEAINRNPGQMIFVPPGDHIITKAIRITKENAGSWGPGRIVQSNAEEAIVKVNGAERAQIRDVTLNITV